MYNDHDQNHRLMAAQRWIFVKNVPDDQAQAARREQESDTTEGGSTTTAYSSHRALIPGYTAIWKRNKTHVVPA